MTTRSTDEMLHELLELTHPITRERVIDLVLELADHINRVRDHQNTATVDWDRHSITDKEGEWTLSPTHWRILSLLLRKPGKILTKKELLAELYGHDPTGGPTNPEAVIGVQMHHLRRRCPWQIRTVKGVGYILEGYTGPLPRRRPMATGSHVKWATRERLMAGR